MITMEPCDWLILVTRCGCWAVVGGTGCVCRKTWRCCSCGASRANHCYVGVKFFGVNCNINLKLGMFLLHLPYFSQV